MQSSDRMTNNTLMSGGTIEDRYSTIEPLSGPRTLSVT